MSGCRSERVGIKRAKIRLAQRQGDRLTVTVRKRYSPKQGAYQLTSSLPPMTRKKPPVKGAKKEMSNSTNSRSV